jgi:general secretion pathway protein G
MEQSTSRSGLLVSAVAVVAFVLGLGSGIGFMVIAVGGTRMCAWSEVRQSHAQRIRADISTIKEALDMYAMHNAGNYPSSLTPLVTPDANGHRYLNHATVPKDPWGEVYGYAPPGPGRPQPRVFTLGRDGLPGGTGDDEDVDYEAIVDGR